MSSLKSSIEGLASQGEVEHDPEARKLFFEFREELTQGKIRAGDFDAAADLLATADDGRADHLLEARVDLVKAQLAYVTNRGNDAPPLLLQAARRLAPVDAALSRSTYLDALSAAIFAGRLARPGGGVREVARAITAAPPPPQVPRVLDLILDDLADKRSVAQVKLAEQQTVQLRIAEATAEIEAARALLKVDSAKIAAASQRRELPTDTQRLLYRQFVFDRFANVIEEDLRPFSKARLQRETHAGAALGEGLRGADQAWLASHRCSSSTLAQRAFAARVASRSSPCAP